MYRQRAGGICRDPEVSEGQSCVRARQKPRTKVAHRNGVGQESIAVRTIAGFHSPTAEMPALVSLHGNSGAPENLVRRFDRM